MAANNFDQSRMLPGGSGEMLSESEQDPTENLEEQINFVKARMTTPLVLEWLSAQFRDHSIESANWRIEKTELLDKISKLEAQIRGHENIKMDLVRRIKMLEFALRSERKKYASSGSNLEVSEIPVASSSASLSTPSGSVRGIRARSSIRANNTKSRNILKQYLAELGADSNLIFSSSGNDISESLNQLNENISNRIPITSSTFVPPEVTPPIVSKTPPLVEKAVEAVSEKEPVSYVKPKIDTPSVVVSKPAPEKEDNPQDEDEDKLRAELEKKFKVSGSKLDKMMNSYSGGSKKKGKKKKQKTSKADMKAMAEMAKKGVFNAQPDVDSASDSSSAATSDSSSTDSKDDLSSLASTIQLDELDELANISVGKVSSKKEKSSKLSTIANDKTGGTMKWKARATLRSHMDAVRSVAFHSKDPLLYSASEDATIKVWDVHAAAKSSKKKKKSNKSPPDIEPIATLRGHTGPVLSVAHHDAMDCIVSGSLDSTIRVWYVPDPEGGIYKPYGKALHGQKLVLEGHNDAVWSVDPHPVLPLVISGSADQTIKIWNLEESTPLRSTFSYTHEGIRGFSTPTSVKIIPTDSKKFVATFNTGIMVVFDIETGKPIIEIDASTGKQGEVSSVNFATPISGSTLDGIDPSRHINSVVVHPKLPLAITGHESKHIRFFDLKSGTCEHSMLAHRESVGGLALDSTGGYLISGGHEASVRMWDLNSKACIQEVSAHRAKWDEAIYGIAGHPSAGYVASGGGDSNIKILQGSLA